MFALLKNSVWEGRIVTGVAIAAATLSIAACDPVSGPQVQPSPSPTTSAPAPVASDTSTCPDGQVNKTDLDNALSPFGDQGYYESRMYAGLLSPMCISFDDALKQVVDMVPQQHKEIDEMNASLDAHQTEIDKAVADVRVVSGARQRVYAAVKQSCDLASPEEYEGDAFQTHMYLEGEQYAWTYFVDATPATLKAWVQHQASWPGINEPELPIYGKRGSVHDEYSELSQIYEGSWDAAYAGVLPELPKDFDAAHAQVCG